MHADQTPIVPKQRSLSVFAQKFSTESDSLPTKSCENHFTRCNLTPPATFRGALVAKAERHELIPNTK